MNQILKYLKWIFLIDKAKLQKMWRIIWMDPFQGQICFLEYFVSKMYFKAVCYRIQKICYNKKVNWMWLKNKVEFGLLMNAKFFFQLYCFNHG